MKKELSKREKEIIGLISKGLISDEIAKELGISTRTVDAHRSNAMQKTGANNSAHLVAMHYEDKIKRITMAAIFVEAVREGTKNDPVINEMLDTGRVDSKEKVILTDIGK